MKIIPRGNKVVLKNITERTEKIGGVEIPNKEREIPEFGEVIASGPDSDLKKGQKVIFNKFSAKDVRVKGVNYVICEDDEILAILREK